MLERAVMWAGSRGLGDHENENSMLVSEQAIG
jgi:hypothetical protein